MEAKIFKVTDSLRSVFFFRILLFFLILPVSAQDELNSKQQNLPGKAPSVRFEHVGLEDGLAQGTINDIMQDSQGYLWMTTQDGLHRYDGHEFEIYSTTPFDTTSLSSRTVWSVTEATNGNLWMTIDGGGLDLMDRASETFTNYSHDPEDSTSLSSDSTFDVKEAKNGDLWVSTLDKGLNHMEAGKKGKFVHYRHEPDNSNSLTSDYLYWINVDTQGKIWAGSMNGLNRIDPETGTVTRFLHDPEAPEKYGNTHNVFDQYFPTGEPEIVWLATGKGLVRLNIEKGLYERFAIVENDGPLNRLNLLHKVLPDPNEQGILWAAGPGTGVVRFDMTTGKFTSYRHDARDPNSLGEDEVFTFFADRSGNMWAGHTVEGLSKFNPGAVNFSHLRHNPENVESLSPGLVWGIYEDKDKTLWVSTYLSSKGGYLTEFNTKTGNITHHQHDPNNIQSLPSGKYNAFAEDKAGEFWVGSTHGLSRFNRKTGRVTKFPHKPPKENQLRNIITAIVPAKDSVNELYIGSAAGLDLFNTQTKKHQSIVLTPKDQEQDPAVVSLVISKEGMLWVGTLEGLFNVDKAGNVNLVSAYNPRDTTTISNNYVSGILERKEEPGILWLATLGGGLNRFNTRTGIAKHYMEKDGLPNNSVYGVLEDSDGTLWMSTNRGISNFDPETETFRNYGLDDGLMAFEYDQFAYFKGFDGMMFFGSMEGVTAFKPEKLAINDTPPQVVLSGLKLFNKQINPGPGSVLKKPVSETEEISLDFSQNEITFDFVALHYGNPTKNSYAYLLEGFDEEWVEAGTRRSASYTNLPPGSYNFRVKAANADGFWSQEAASVQVSVLPPWYRTWWAYLIFTVLLGTLVFAINSYQRQRLQKKEHERTLLREAELRAEAENRRRADTEQLSNIGRAVTSSLSITRIIDTVYEHVNQLMDAAIFGVGIYNKDKNRLDFPATKENGNMLPAYAHRLNEKNRLAVWCYNNSEEIIIGDAAKETAKYVNKFLPPVEGHYSKSVIYLPLVQQGRTIGVITTQSFKEHAYTPYHVHLLRNLATYAAIALDNASAYRQLDSSLRDLKLMQEQLVQQEKLASLGQLTAGIAHEIKNPLNFVNNFSELNVELIDEISEDLSKLEKTTVTDNIRQILLDVKSNLAKIQQHGTRADSIVKSMLQHSRGGSGMIEPTDLNSLIKEYVNLSFHGMRAGKNPINVRIDLQLDEKVDVVPLREDFSRVILNLCNNAFDAMREKYLMVSGNGEYMPQLTVRTISENGHILIQVEDNGSGIPEASKDKILQPFFTTKKGTEGTGLGLSITHDIVKAHSGTLEIVTEKNRFTRFDIKVPAKTKKNNL